MALDQLTTPAEKKKSMNFDQTLHNIQILTPDES